MPDRKAATGFDFQEKKNLGDQLTSTSISVKSVNLVASEKILVAVVTPAAGTSSSVLSCFILIYVEAIHLPN